MIEINYRKGMLKILKIIKREENKEFLLDNFLNGGLNEGLYSSSLLLNHFSSLLSLVEKCYLLT